jgi:hypothetical protein
VRGRCNSLDKPRALRDVALSLAVSGLVGMIGWPSSLSSRGGGCDSVRLGLDSTKYD